MPTLSQLTYIVTVDRLRHFAKAAQVCHVSQPSLSAQIKKVEDLLGMTIFDRNKKPILPTEKGRRFIEQAKIVLREHHKLVANSHQQQGRISGNCRIGIIPTVAPYLVPLFIEAFSQRYDDVRLVIDELKTDTILRHLTQDQLDVGILATPLRQEGLQQQMLFWEPFYLYVGKDHPLAHRSQVSEAQLSHKDIWLLEDGHCLRQQVVKICSLRGKSGVYPNVQLEGGNLETLRHLIQRGKGYTLVPHLFMRTLSHAERNTHIKPFKHPAPCRQISLVYRRTQWKVDILSALAQTIRDHLPKELRPKND